MHMKCLDMEDVLTPEIWMHVAKEIGIEELKFTTQDIADYDVLMKKRLKILKDHGKKIPTILLLIKRPIMEPTNAIGTKISTSLTNSLFPSLLGVVVA